MPEIPVSVEWFLRASRDLAACLGRLQSPGASPSAQKLALSKGRAASFVMRDAAVDMPGDFEVLVDSPSLVEPIEQDRDELLQKGYPPFVVRLLQHAGRVSATVDSAAMPQLVSAQCDAWWTTALELHQLERPEQLRGIRALRERREALVTGVALVSVASTASSNEKDAMLRLARATVRLRSS